MDTLCGDVLWVDRLHGLSTACHALDGLTYQPLESEQQHGLSLLLELTETNQLVLAAALLHCLTLLLLVKEKLEKHFGFPVLS